MNKVIYKPTPFTEAIQFFQNKVQIPTAHYTDLMNKAHTKAFMVAGAMKEDILCDFQKAIGKALEKGTTLEEFRNDFDNIVAKYGWSYKGSRGWRTKVIYDTNLKTSYSAGHWEQAQQTKELRPYGIYIHTLSNNPREQHQAWNNKVIALDDPWWNYRWPPNGWGCNCTVRTANQRELNRLGLEIEQPSPDKTISQTLKTPEGEIQVETVAGVDPSFAYNPGKSAFGMKLTTKKVQEAKADGTWKNWQPISWGNKSRETWKTLGRPEKLPVDIAIAKLGEKVSTKEGLKPILEKTIHGKEGIFDTADKAKVLLNVDTLLHIQPNRSPFVPLIPEVLLNPFEVWLDFEEHEVTGKIELRKKYIKHVVANKDISLYMAIQTSKGQLVGWTFIPVSRGNYINNIRQGRLIWARE